MGDEQHPPPRATHAGHFPQGDPGVGKDTQREGAHDGVEATIGERQALGVALHEIDLSLQAQSAPLDCRLPEHPRGEVQARERTHAPRSEVVEWEVNAGPHAHLQGAPDGQGHAFPP